MALAVMAAGAHTMSIAAPALAEQDRLAREADAAAERAVVPSPAATDGLPVPALLGGIVLAFAVGLAGGHVQRRRRLVRRSATAKARPAPAPTPSVPARPAPPPPEPVAPPEPKPVQIAASPPPPPPPPPVRATGPRILRFRPAPAPPPPEPDELVADEPRVAEPPAREPVAEPPEPEPAAEAPADEVAEPTPEPVAEAPADEIVEPAPADEVAEPAADEVAEPAPADEVVEPSPAAEPPRRPARGPEMPRRDQAPRQEPAATPLAHGPESVRHPRGKAQARPRPEAEPEVALPARRFARAHPWPRDAESLWTCEIAWKAGYLKSNFRAMAGPPGATRRKPLGESPSLRWTLMTDPEPPTPEMIASVKALVSALAEAGWERAGQGNAWYALRFVWRRDGVPGTIAVRDATESAEPPTR